MILEFLEYATTDCAPYARKLGYLKEAIAIRARQRRLGAAWEPHLENTRATIREAIGRCRRRRTALVMGSGLLLDIPLPDLADAFGDVLLADAVHLRSARRAARSVANASLLTHDLTALAEDLDARVANGWRGHPVPAPNAFLDAPEIDLVVSANLLAQLPIFPAAALQRRAGLEGDALDRFCRAVIQAHLDYLRRFDATVCLVTEVTREALDRSGACVQSHDALFGAALPGGGARWSWDLAPLGELSRGYALRNEVVGYCDISTQPPPV